MSGLDLISNNGHFTVGPTGLFINGEVSFEEWQSYGERLAFVEGAIQWVIGDWLNYGERKWGEMYPGSENETQYDTWRDYKSVAKRVELSTRVDNLSWAHHRLVAPLPAKEQTEWLGVAVENGWSTRDLERELRYARRGVKIEAIAGESKLAGRYPVIYADPPWEYDFPISGSRKIDQHYPTMSFEDICAMDIASIAADDAILFLWAVFLQKGLTVLEAWGFEYRTEMIWCKPSFGMGQWVRKSHEICLIGVRGEIPTPWPDSRPDSVLDGPKAATGEHSSKPDQMYEVIEAMYPQLAKIELFATQKRKGWASWGNQV